ncbi:hypothetical protein GALL_432970 [mine drainage metagenome]|uniref:Uncharacterized protein n=1 Tax=mine drainage metagenome TaxID=410659 RepID=A0A1J5PUA0_9ZZZZ
MLRHAVDEQEPEAALRREHLTDQHAEQAKRKADPETIDDIWQAGGHQNPEHGAAGRKPQYLGRADQHGRQAANRTEREQGHRHQSVHDTEGDLGGHAETENQQHDRIERDFRDGVEACKYGLGNISGEAPHSEDQTERKTDQRREHESQNKRFQRRCGMIPKHPRAEETGEID